MNQDGGRCELLLSPGWATSPRREAPSRVRNRWWMRVARLGGPLNLATKRRRAFTSNVRLQIPRCQKRNVTFRPRADTGEA